MTHVENIAAIVNALMLGAIIFFGSLYLAGSA